MDAVAKNGSTSKSNHVVDSVKQGMLQYDKSRGCLEFAACASPQKPEAAVTDVGENNSKQLQC